MHHLAGLCTNIHERQRNRTLVDPSAAMLDLAREKLSGMDRVAILKPIKAEQLNIDEQADVITAIQSGGARFRIAITC